MDKTQEYDGSTDHGVDVDELVREALKLLDARRDYLTNELKKQCSIITGFVANDKEKNEAYTKVHRLDLELWALDEEITYLLFASPAVEYERELDHKDFDPSILDKYK
jgi:Arc/MetJ-type ribon-helix-helix transcriptional regulator